MRSLSTMTAVLLVMLAGGCAATTPSAHDPHAAAFTASQAAPADQARVYLLPTRSKGMFQDLDGRAALVIFPRNGDDGARLASTDKSTFVAFDIGPGSYDLQARGDDPLAKVSRPMTFEAGKTYYLRPTFFRSAQEVAANAQQGKPGMGFDQVPPADATAEIARMNMALLEPDGAAFIARTRTAAAAPATSRTEASPPAVPAPAAVVSAPPPPASAPAEASTAAPTPPADGFSAVERKLKELKRLHQEGLITQQDYDDKRKAILNAY